jgi:hypothetical protein
MRRKPFFSLPVGRNALGSSLPTIRGFEETAGGLPARFDSYLRDFPQSTLALGKRRKIECRLSGKYLRPGWRRGLSQHQSGKLIT